jgi:hypothetical protein
MQRLVDLEMPIVAAVNGPASVHRAASRGSAIGQAAPAGAQWSSRSPRISLQGTSVTGQA